MLGLSPLKGAILVEALCFFMMGACPPLVMGCDKKDGTGVKDVDYKEGQTGTMPPLKIVGTSPGTVTVTVNGGSTVGHATATPDGTGASGSTGSDGSSSSASATVASDTTQISVNFTTTAGTPLGPKIISKAKVGL